MHLFTLSLCCMAVTAAFSPTAQASQQSEALGFIQGSSFNLQNRVFYFNRDFRNGGFNGAGTNTSKPDQENGYREEAAYGIISFFESGFTQGTVGFGVDAYGYLGIRLDGGGGRTGTLLAPIGSDGEPERDWSEAGGVLKLRVSNTVLKYGEQQFANPVVGTGDARLLPETATGFFLSSEEIEDLALDVGHITAMNGFNSSNSDDGLLIQYADDVGDSISWAGLTYAPVENFSLSLYGSQVEDTWRRYYAGLAYTHDFGEERSLGFDLNIYRTNDRGRALAGEIGNTDWSLASKYVWGGHAFTLAYQQIDDNAGFDYIGFDGIYLANSVQYSDFNAPGERSWQLRYDMDMANYGAPGLTLMARYVRGRDIDSAGADIRSGFLDIGARNEKHWERNLEAKYVLQNGPAKDLSMRVRHSTHRGSSNQIDGDTDEVRLIVEYPLNIL
jgi:imipenem/basic amino acid-specific outer membrane pore